MTNTFVYPIRFGASKERPVIPETEKFNAAIAELMELGEASLTFLPIHWLSSEYRSKPEAIVGKIVKTLKDAPAEQIIFDCGGPNFEGVIDPSVTLAICDFITAANSEVGFSSVVVLCPGAKSDVDVDVVRLLECDESRDVSFVFSEGTSFGSRWNRLSKSHVNLQSQVRKLFDEYSISLAAKIRQKIVRYSGYFKLSDSASPVPYYFSLEDCHAEIISAVSGCATSFIEESEDEIGFVVDCRDCNWFKQPVSEALFETASKNKVLYIYSDSDVKKVDFSNIVLMLPVCRSGSSAADLVCTLNESIVAVWSLLSIRNSDDESRALSSDTGAIRSRSITKEMDGKFVSFSVDYVVDVPVLSSPSLEIWKSINISPENHRELDASTYKQWSSAAIWALILDAGVAPEKWGPSDRPMAPIIPNFRQIIADNQNLIASMIKNAATSTSPRRPAENFIVVSTNEPSAKAIGESLMRDDQDRTIEIHRDILNCVTEYGIEGLAEHLTADDELSKKWDQIESDVAEISEINKGIKNRSLKAIIVDEFYYGGTTLTTMERICQRLRIDVVGYFALASMTDLKLDREYQTHSFYQFNYPGRRKTD